MRATGGGLWVQRTLLDEKDFDDVLKAVLESYTAAGLVQRLKSVVAEDESAIREHLQRMFISQYRLCISMGNAAILYQSKSGVPRPVGILAAVPMQTWLKESHDARAGVSITGLIDQASVPRRFPALQQRLGLHQQDAAELAFQTRLSSRAEVDGMAWYDSARAWLMRIGMERVAPVVGAEQWPELLESSIYFTAGALSPSVQGKGMSVKTFVDLIEGMKTKGSRLGWGFTINLNAFPMLVSLKATGNVRIVLTTNLAKVAEQGVLADDLRPQEWTSLDAEGHLASRWQVWVIIFDFYGITGSTFPPCSSVIMQKQAKSTSKL